MKQHAAISDAIEQFKRTRGFREAEAKLAYHAVWLIGPPHPVAKHGKNSLIWPVRLGTGIDPTRAAQRTISEHWEGSKNEPWIVLLERVWTMSDEHAARLKSALHARLLGDDPEMRQLNGNWIDRMDWNEKWRALLDEAILDLRAAGDDVPAFSEEMRLQRTYRYAQQRVRGGR